MKTKDDIVAYLKGKHIYGRVINYYEKYKSFSWNSTLDLYRGVDNFPWDSTTEGGDYWLCQQMLFKRWIQS